MIKKYIVLIVATSFVFFFSGCNDEDELPAISRTMVKKAGPDFAVVQGRVYIEGSSALKRTGVCWKLKSVPEKVDKLTVEFPQLSDDYTESETAKADLLVMRIAGLLPDTVYYASLFAENGDGVFYSYPTRIKTKKIPEGCVYVESGEFMMGNSVGNSDELPLHKVELTEGYFISEKEVTNAEYAEFMNEEEIAADGTLGGELLIDLSGTDVGIESVDTGFRPKAGKENYPVVSVTWKGAKAFCEWRGGDLPTEAEWEYAARGGAVSESFAYSGSNSADESGWFSDNSGGSIQPGKQKKGNELHIFDMSGNVLEWCSDWYGENYYGESTSRDPEGPKSGNEKVLRGGAYNLEAYPLTRRYASDPATTAENIGFRVRIK